MVLQKLRRSVGKVYLVIISVQCVGLCARVPKQDVIYSGSGLF